MSRPLLGLHSAQLVHSISLVSPAVGEYLMFYCFALRRRHMLSLLLLMLLSFCSHRKTPEAKHFLVHGFRESRQWLDRFITSEPLDWMQKTPHSRKWTRRRPGTRPPWTKCNLSSKPFVVYYFLFFLRSWSPISDKQITHWTENLLLAHISNSAIGGTKPLAHEPLGDTQHLHCGIPCFFFLLPVALPSFCPSLSLSSVHHSSFLLFFLPFIFLLPLSLSFLLSMLITYFQSQGTEASWKASLTTGS